MSNSPQNNVVLTNFNNISDGYNGIINIQLDKLKTTPIYTTEKDMFSVFKIQFKQLEQEEKKLQQNIQKYGFNDAYLQEYINISQYKLKVLQQLQTEIQKTNLQKKQTVDHNSNLPTYYITL